MELKGNMMMRGDVLVINITGWRKK